MPRLFLAIFPAHDETLGLRDEDHRAGPVAMKRAPGTPGGNSETWQP
jgi:hypothetical protein